MKNDEYFKTKEKLASVSFSVQMPVSERDEIKGFLDKCKNIGLKPNLGPVLLKFIRSAEDYLKKHPELYDTPTPDESSKIEKSAEKNITKNENENNDHIKKGDTAPTSDQVQNEDPKIVEATQGKENTGENKKIKKTRTIFGKR